MSHIILSTTMAAVWTAAALGQAANEPAKTVKPHQIAEAAARQDQRMAWWREARFGLFIHWGLYAVPAGEWKGQTNHAEWIRESARIPIAEYDQLLGQFNPTKFDADAWVTMAREAGMKYLVITSKHHDGFCLWDSAQTEYDVMSTPFQRDILKELAEACRRGGIRLCFYHSIMDWHHPDYLPRRSWEQRPSEGADFDRYVSYMKSELRELVDNYGPLGVLWFDGQWEDTWTHPRGLDLCDYVRGLQPDIIINNRVDTDRPAPGDKKPVTDRAGDYRTPEQEIPAAGLPGDWETCMTMNDHWGYNRADKNWKSTTTLIRMLADIASKGGNFLLNVGPTAEGEFPPESVERLREIGAWMKVNGESIYGTQAGPLPPVPWGRCTMKQYGSGTRLYLHVFDWPKDGRLPLPGLLNTPRGARLLSDPEHAALATSREDDAVVVKLPAAAPDAADSVVVLEVPGAPDVAMAPEIVSESEIFVGSAEVQIRTPRADLKLHYTTEDRDPTASDPVVGGPVEIDETSTITARAFRGREPASPSARATFRRVELRPAEKVGDLPGGVEYEFYEGQWERLPDFGRQTPRKTGVVPNFDLSPRGQVQENFGFRYRGYVIVPRDGMYRFSVVSDDGSRLLIGDQVVVNNDGLHSAEERGGFVALKAGAHPVTVEFFERGGEDALEVWYSGPGIDRSRVPDSALGHAK